MKAKKQERSFYPFTFLPFYLYYHSIPFVEGSS